MPLPFTWTLALRADPPFSSKPVRPSGIPSFDLNFQPRVGIAFQHGTPPQSVLASAWARNTCVVVEPFFHRKGRRIGDFRKAWAAACKEIGLSGRIVHDLRRSGVRHLIQAGVDPHTVMAFSGHRTPSMLKRYHIIALDDLRRAAERGSAYESDREAGTVVAFPGMRRERAE